MQATTKARTMKWSLNPVAIKCPFCLSKKELNDIKIINNKVNCTSCDKNKNLDIFFVISLLDETLQKSNLKIMSFNLNNMTCVISNTQ